MSFSYKPLWKLLIDYDMSKKDLTSLRESPASKPSRRKRWVGTSLMRL